MSVCFLNFSQTNIKQRVFAENRFELVDFWGGERRILRLGNFST